MGIEGTYLNMHAKLLQSCLTLHDPMDSSPPGSSVPGILQARILVWVAMSFFNAYTHAKALQLCLTLCNPINGSPPRLLCPWDSPGKNTRVGCQFLLQCTHACMLIRFSCVRLCVTLWTAAHQAPPSTGFSRQEYWSGLPFPSPVQDTFKIALVASTVTFSQTTTI